MPYTKNNLKGFLGFILIVFLIIAGFPFSTNKAQAAALTGLSDVQTNQTTAALSSHTIQFVTPTGIVASATTTLTFDNSTSISASLATADVALVINGLVASTTVGAPGATQWGFVRTSATVITISAPTATSVSASSSIIIKIGTSAGGTNRITNGSVGTTLLTIAGTIADSGIIALPVITNSIVNITATVAPSITFTIDQNSLQFGTLTTGAARWATTTVGGSTASTTGNVLTIATNSTSGFNITLQGSTLTASTGVISAITGSPTAPAPGTAQFGLTATSTGGTGASVASNYGGSLLNYYYGATATTSDTLGSGTSPTATVTYTIRYVANISGSTPAGSYSTNITYIATPLF